ncbi:uncharacterized protein LOC125903812, partial [Epinephelus fuscoguttatus]|uniref:uncharacterized protein LOC125903812 n=1 Tax=Epinephelus fuscoguttatus TaxID=293821 RepID=UPI0020D1B426
MAAGLPSKAVSQDLRFLIQLASVPVSEGLCTHDSQNMMTNVVMFLRHTESSFEKASKLKKKDFATLQYEIKRIMADVQKKMVVHRQKVLRHKTDNQLGAVEEKKFMITARKKIPKLFESLAGNGRQQNEHSKLIGYIMGYLSMLTGHRSIVLTNMTKEHVMNFETWDHGKKFQVLVDDHKTVRSFGQAAFSLNNEEFTWLECLTNGKCCKPGQASKYVFHTVLGKQIQKPLNFLHLAWVDAGMQGTVSFNMIRSSVSTQANKYLSEKERKQVAKHMCHDPSTAERFYVALPDKVMGYETRKLRMKALQSAAANPPPDDKSDDDELILTDTSETSSSDEEPVYDDQPESSSSLSDEELKSRRQKRDQKEVGFPTYIQEAGLLTETSGGENDVCVPEPQNQMTLECVDETPPENVPATPAGEKEVCAPEPQSQMTCDCVDETPPENVPATPAGEKEVCAPEPQSQMTCEYVDETPPENVPATPAGEKKVCAPEPQSQMT